MSLADAFDGFIIDLDGVVYVDGVPLPGAVEALQALAAVGKPVVFLTNDPRGSRASIVARLQSLGLATAPSHVLTSGAAVAAYLRSLGSRPTYVIGSADLKAEIAWTGSPLVHDDAAATAEVAVVGCYPGVNYQELRAASTAIRAGAEFLATNRDPTFPTIDGPAPATGAILAAVETATGQSARVLGKPDRHIFETAAALLGGVDRVAVVGDSLQSDIAGGQAAGLATVLVLTGTSQLADLTASAPHPDAVLPSLANLLS